MKISAEVTIENGTFDEWFEFFESYKEERLSFI